MNLDKLSFPEDADHALCWAARLEYRLRMEAWLQHRIGPDGMMRLTLHQFGRELAKMKDAGREMQEQMEEFWELFGSPPDEPHLRVVK